MDSVCVFVNAKYENDHFFVYAKDGLVFYWPLAKEDPLATKLTDAYMLEFMKTNLCIPFKEKGEIQYHQIDFKGKYVGLYLWFQELFDCFNPIYMQVCNID